MKIAKDLLARYSLSRCISSDDSLARYNQNPSLLAFCIWLVCYLCIQMLTKRGEDRISTQLVPWYDVMLSGYGSEYHPTTVFIIIFQSTQNTTERWWNHVACIRYLTEEHLTDDSRQYRLVPAYLQLAKDLPQKKLSMRPLYPLTVPWYVQKTVTYGTKNRWYQDKFLDLELTLMQDGDSLVPRDGCLDTSCT